MLYEGGGNVCEVLERNFEASCPNQKWYTDVMLGKYQK